MPPILLIFAAAAYAGLFWTMAIRRPTVALTLIFATSPMNQDVSGGGPLKFSMAEINLLLTIPVLLFRGRRFGGGGVLAASAGYLLVGLGCSLVNWRSTTLVCLVQISIYLLLAVIVFATLARTEEDFRPCFDGFILFSLVLAGAVIILRSPYVLGMHKNNCGCAIAAAFLIALELSFQAQTHSRRLLYLGALAILGAGLMLTLSRGSWLSAIVGSGMIFALRRQFGLMLRALLALGVFAAIIWQFLPAESKKYAAGVSDETYNIKARYISKDFAMDQFRTNPVIGVGVGLRKEFDATNLVFCTLAETGVIGMAALVTVFATVIASLWKARRGLERSSFSFSVVAIAGALTMGKLAHGMVDHYWVRGTLMAAWAAVGMAAWVARAQRARRRRIARAKRELVRDFEELPVHASALAIAI